MLPQCMLCRWTCGPHDYPPSWKLGLMLGFGSHGLQGCRWIGVTQARGCGQGECLNGAEIRYATAGVFFL
ncbi:uncharacterized protein EKO05_0002766 [Ascochyta rabiei]|uniref:uncharacterized protein n=1 Tax=Didymella rabiei TaxID=5454 RepID=UPI002208DDBB|nr:uncharacterized protein EKO05_0002766 [Ascochyta rabiei]UPX12203.1 hypothetical protein EKO05_0002766 [Ascochyta rabiei]